MATTHGYQLYLLLRHCVLPEPRVSKPRSTTAVTNVVNVFMTLPGMWGTERFGRRRLLLVGAVGMCVCEFIIAIVGVTISVDNKAGQKVLVAFVCYILYVLCFMPICF